jgi:hypothetical protein
MFSFQNLTKSEVVAGMRTILTRQALLGMCGAAVVYAVWGPLKANLAGVGLFWSLMDTCLVFRGVLRGFGVTLEKRLRRLLLQTFVLRVALAASLVSLLLVMKQSVFEMLLSFVILYVFYIINLIIFTSSSKKKRP